MSSSSATSKLEKEKQKLIQEKCQAILNEMLRDEDNKYCVDCDAKGPRWASWNLGIFLCIRCAGIHRNLGVHISRVKSVNLDTWTPEQVVTMQQMGNSRARAVYEANLPDNFRRPQTDAALENFIRAKYEHKKYIAQEWVKPHPPKVNWDSEVEDNLRKKKESKKQQIQNDIGPLPTAIPKPKPSSSSPAVMTKRSTSGEPENAGLALKMLEINEKVKTTVAEDLLGLMNTSDCSTLNIIGSDPFASPLKSSQENTSSKDDLGSVFASDGLQDPLHSQKMSKESILSLYGQTPSNNANPFVSSVFSNSAPSVNLFPQMPSSSYNPNSMNLSLKPPFSGLNHNDIGGGLNGTSVNASFNTQPDLSQVQQQMFGLNMFSCRPQINPSSAFLGNFGQTQPLTAPQHNASGGTFFQPHLTNTAVSLGCSTNASSTNLPAPAVGSYAMLNNFVPTSNFNPGSTSAHLVGLNGMGNSNTDHCPPNGEPTVSTSMWK